MYAKYIVSLWGLLWCRVNLTTATDTCYYLGVGVKGAVERMS